MCSCEHTPLAVQEVEDIVDEGRMGIRQVALAAMAADACQLQRMLIGEDMVDLLGIGRAAGRNGDVDGMKISNADVDQTTVPRIRVRHRRPHCFQ